MMLRKPERRVRIKAVGCSVLFLAVAAMLGGCVWIQEWLNPNKPPVAIIQANPTSGKAPLEVIFDASESYNPDGDGIVSYQWDFGGGYTAEGTTVVHGFGSRGEYTVRLTTIDDKGAEGTAEITIIVYEPSETVVEHEFDAQAGTEFDTRTGLKISVPPLEVNEGPMLLSVRYDPTPSQPPDEYTTIRAGYAISLTSKESSSHGQRLSSTYRTQGISNVTMMFEIPAGTDPYTVLIIEWTDQGWVVPLSEGNLGGTIRPDRQRISISVPIASSSAYSIGSKTSVGEIWHRFALAISDSLYCGPIYPEVTHEAEVEREKAVVTLKARSPSNWFGGVWFKVWTSKESNLITKTWTPPDEPDLNDLLPPWIYDPIRDWYLPPTASHDRAQLTMEFLNIPRSSATVVFDAYKALNVQVLQWIFHLVPGGRLAKTLWEHMVPILDFSFNVNPLEAAKEIATAIVKEAIKLGISIVVTPAKLIPLVADIATCLSTYSVFLLGYEYDVVVSTRDTTPPTAPADFKATPISSSQVDLAWAPSTDNVGVKGYKIYRDGSERANVTQTYYSDTGLTPSTRYCYAVSAYDAADNESQRSAEVCVTTPAGQPPVQKPNPPKLLEPGSSSAPGPTINTLTPVFRWEGVANAERYALAVSVEPYGPANVIYRNENLTGTSFTLPSGWLEHGKKYRWNMQAATGTEWSEVSTTTLYFQTSLPPTSAVTLTVASLNPNSGVSITVSPNDTSGQGNGTTPFSRTYINNTVVTLTAPATAGGNNFQKWQRNGVDWVTTQPPTTTTVTMDADYTMMAVYVSATPPATGTIQVSATLDGRTWEGVISYFRLIGPQNWDLGGALMAPAVFRDLPPGIWTFEFHSGGPSGATFTNVSPSSTQNLAAGGTIIFTLNFATSTPPVDTTPPAVVSTNPVGGDLGAPVTDVITATFSEEIQRGTGGVTVVDKGGNTVSIREVSVSGRTLTIRLSSLLAYDSGYTVRIEAGAVKDLAGNPSAAYSWSFLTQGSVTGEITSTSVNPPSPAQVGQQVGFSCTVRNTSGARHTFMVGLSVWKVGSSIDAAIIDTSKQITLDPGQQQVVQLATYTFASDQTGDWNYQFGLWRDSVGGSLLERKPSPAEVLTVYTRLPDLIVEDIWTVPSPPVASDYTTLGVRIRNQGQADVTSPFLLALHFDATYYGHASINGVVAGGVHTSEWQAVKWPSDTNPHTIKAVVDPDNKVLEKSGDNNELSKQFQAVSPPQQTGTLFVEAADLRLGSVLKEAAVYVDGQYRGVTPPSGYLRIDNLMAGDHALRVTKTGYRDWTGTVTIPPGKATYKAVFLEEDVIRLPSVETRVATDPTETSAILHGAIINDGGASIVERRFDWGTTSACSDGSTNQVTVSGNSFSFRLTGLQPGKTYYFRARARNSAGWGEGAILSFRTLDSVVQAGQIVSEGVSPSPAFAWRSVAFSCRVKNTGTVRHTFPVSLNVWRPGTSPSASPVTFSAKHVTLDPNQEETVEWTTGFKEEQTGEWSYQFNLWKDAVGGTLLVQRPSPPGLLTVVKFKVGDPVYVYGTGVKGLRVRDAPCGNRIDNKPDGATGVVLEGPVSCVLAEDGQRYTWWKIRWDDGRIGWSVQDHLGLALG
ncbi:MAG: Ig-like domain-containing protein [Candidatus Acetothermia bacterium]|jgi:PKD repeat protein|nr:Ig-like domain-containing protein [Candidatus Acetothermia bacterium]